MIRKTNKQGSMLMIVLVMLIVAAIIAAQLMPDEQTITKREDESFYNSDLSQLREAIDLATLASGTTNWQGFLASDTPASISEKIASLSNLGFLRNPNVRDNSIPEFAWSSTTAGLNYWVVSTNYASNTSFEIVVDALDPFLVSKDWEKESTASATVTSDIKLNSMAIDEYPYQNKLGDNTKGENAIKMIKITK